MKRSGFTPIAVLIVIAATFIFGGYLFSHYSQKNSSSSPSRQSPASTASTTPPEISLSLISPRNGDRIGGKIKLEAAVSSTDSNVVIDFYRYGNDVLLPEKLIGEVSSSPYSLMWDTRTEPAIQNQTRMSLTIKAVARIANVDFAATSVIVSTYITGPGMYWSDAVNLINSCQVKSVENTVAEHGTIISLTLKNGRSEEVSRTGAPSVDEIFNVLKDAMSACGPIRLNRISNFWIQ